MERSKFIQELEKLVVSGEVLTASQLQQKENISRTKVDRYVTLGKYKRLKLGKIFILVKNNNE